MSELTVVEVTQIPGNTRIKNMVVVNNVERFTKNDKTITIKFVSGDSIMVDPDSLDTIQFSK